ncbi:MAG: hypothetical protein R2772_11255, partial [Chitinophagales bacterium]
FSQGAATASRFAMKALIPIDHLFLYGGSFAHDLDWTKLSPQLKIHFIYGDEDPLVKEEQVSRAKDFVVEQGFSMAILKFKGKHKIEPEALHYIQRSLAS